MKKGLLLLTFLCALSAAHAQIGLRAGLGSANFSNGDVQRANNSTTTFHLGAYYGIQATEKLSVESGLFYSGKGFKIEPTATTEEAQESLNYLEIPLLARYTIGSAFNVFAGPQVGFLLSRTYTKGSEKITDTAPVGGYEIGGVFGVGYQLTTELNLQASYDFGISPFEYYKAEVNNTVFKLSLGYTLPSKVAKEKAE